MDLSKFTYKNNESLFYDYKVCSEFLKNTVFEENKQNSIFHCYTDLLTDKEEWVLKSFLEQIIITNTNLYFGMTTAFQMKWLKSMKNMLKLDILISIKKR